MKNNDNSKEKKLVIKKKTISTFKNPSGEDSTNPTTILVTTGISIF